jgi:hypothetical protein
VGTKHLPVSALDGFDLASTCLRHDDFAGVLAKGAHVHAIRMLLASIVAID